MLELVWIPGFRPKHHTPDFQPASPSISRLISDRRSDKLLCPVRAYFRYLDRSELWWENNPNSTYHDFLWTVPSSTIQASSHFILTLIQDLVGTARRDAGERRVEFGVHQNRKLAASHSTQAGHNERIIKEKMGFSEVKILKKNYIAKVPDLKVACVLPGGSFIPNRAHSLLDSDSDLE